MTDNAAGRPKLTTGPTLSDQAYKALREDITTGALKPGQRLTERGLAEHLGVSPTPVREALQRLEHERLIERDAVRSIRVAAPSVARLRELALIEVALRGASARSQAARMAFTSAAVARSAARRAATPRRATSMRDSSRSLATEGSVTRIARTASRSMSRSCSSRWSASRTGVGLTPRCSARPRSVRRCPGLSAPVVMSSRSAL